MLEKPNIKKVDRQDDSRPTNIEQLIEKYGLEYLWKYIDKLVDYSNTRIGKDFINTVYPIGSIYMSVNSINPSSLFGGTWVAWGSGRVPVGVDANDTDFDTAEETGGEKTHTLTIDEMPSHNHTVKGWADIADGSGTYRVAGAMGQSTDYSTRYTGGGQAHNIMQPYITCYMWKRTA